MADTLRSFLVEYGFAVDNNSRAKAESATRAAEDRITAANAAALKQRLDADKRAQAERIRAAIAAGEQITEADRRFVLEQEKIRIAASDADRKRQERDAKQGREHREETLKQIRATALKVAGVVAGLVTAVEGAAAGIFVATDKAAKSLEQLNYSAQITGASPKSIQAVVYALTQLGDSSEDAQKSLANFGNNLENYKAFEDILKNMNIQTRDANGHLRDTTELFVEYTARLKDLPRATREANSTGWGISAETIQAAIRPGFRGRIAEGERDQAAAGNDVDANAKAGTAFEQSARHLRNQASNIAGRVTGNLFEQLQPELDKLSKWMDEHGQQVGEILDRIAADIIALAKAVIDNLAKVDWNDALTKVEDFAKGFDKLAKQYFGEEGSLTVPFVLFGAVLATKVLSPLNGILTAMRLLKLLSLPPWLAALLAYTTAGTAASIETAKAIQNADPAKNDLYIDPETGVGMNVSPGSGNQRTGGLGDPNDSILGRAWNWTKQKLGFGGGSDVGTGGRTVVDQSIPAGGKALLDTIASGEAKDYNVLNGGGTFSSYADHPDAGGHRAAGRYQDLPSTWKGIQRETGITDFSPASQDKGNWYLAQRDYKAHTGRDLLSDLKSNDPATIARIGTALSSTWVSLNGSFSGKYRRYYERNAASAAAPASGPIGDAAYMAAQQRREAGKQAPGDDALMATYRQQQEQGSGSGSLARAHKYFHWIDASNKLANQSGDLTTVDRRTPEDVLRASMSPARRALLDAMKNGTGINPLPRITRPLGDSQSLRQSIHSSTRGDTTLNNAPVFNVTTNDVRAGMDAARQVADRGGRDLLRNANSMEA